MLAYRVVLGYRVELGYRARSLAMAREFWGRRVGATVPCAVELACKGTGALGTCLRLCQAPVQMWQRVSPVPVQMWHG